MHGSRYTHVLASVGDGTHERIMAAKVLLVGVGGIGKCSVQCVAMNRAFTLPSTFSCCGCGAGGCDYLCRPLFFFFFFLQAARC
jgi:hypothetical protein